MDKNIEKVGKKYSLPSPELLDCHDDENNQVNEASIQDAKDRLEKLLASLKIDAFVSAVHVGSRVTQFEISLSPGVKVDRIKKIEDNIVMALEAESIRIQAPIPGKNAVGIEVPNKVPNTVYLRPLLESKEWTSSKTAIPILLGRNTQGKVAMFDLAKAPHLLIAGTVDSGKSVYMNTFIMSLLFRFSPDELKLIMIDPKVIELDMYNAIPHLITPVVIDSEKARLALRWAVDEMERRIMVLKKVKAKTLAGFNSRPPDSQPVLDEEGKVIPQRLPIIVVIVDELSDLMMSDAKNEVEMSICRITQMGRAVGIHLVAMTSATRKTVITGLVKANIPTKIAFRVIDSVSSRIILDCSGAEKLLGAGDMLFNPSNGAKLERIQGAYVSEEEVYKVVDAVSKNA